MVLSEVKKHMQICLWQSAVCFASAASTAWSAAFRASSKVMVVFVNENDKLIKTGAAFATKVAKCSYGKAVVQLPLR